MWKGLFQRVTDLPTAQKMSRIGALACGFVAVLSVYSSIGDGKMVEAIVGGGLAGACAVGLWRGWAPAGWIAVIFYVLGAVATAAAAPMSLSDSADWLAWVVLVVLLPLCLIFGLRGSLAWTRLRRRKPARS